MKTLDAATSGMTVLSGCSKLLHGETKLEQLTLVNIADAEHGVRVVVRRDEEDGYRKGFSLLLGYRTTEG